MWSLWLFAIAEFVGANCDLVQEILDLFMTET